MATKRKFVPAGPKASSHDSMYGLNETFDDSEDDFRAGNDLILLEDQHATKRHRRLEKQEQILQSSDEEVLRYESDEPLSDDAGQLMNDDHDEGTAGEDDESENWGTLRANYYDADVLETEQDAHDEETEARRLQQKQIDQMSTADFGFDESTWGDGLQTAQFGRHTTVVEKLPEAKIPTGASVDEIVDILQSRYPEFEPLKADFVSLQPLLSSLKSAARNEVDANSIGARPKLLALSAYLGAIAMYFAVLSADTQPNHSAVITAVQPNALREHAVIELLARSRQLWVAARNMQFVQQSQRKISRERKISDKAPATQRAQVPSVSLLDQEISLISFSGEEKPRSKDDDPARSVPERKETKPKPKRFTDLETLLAQSAEPGEEESDMGDEGPLSEAQLSEKAQKKKSLRFYTSQIAQKANKRGLASREAGGDDDIPYKERQRDKQERLVKEAEKRGRKTATLDEELDSDGESVAEDHYYQSLTKKRDQKRAENQAQARAYAQAAKQGARVYEDEEVGPDGKRGITYAIQKNKGLTPKRSKDVRNPRVKKRKKYDEKKKKLGSIRQVYNGGQKAGTYGGELTGIKTNVVKSVKL